MTHAKGRSEAEGDVPWRTRTARLAPAPSWLAPRNADPSIAPVAMRESSVAPEDLAHIPDIVVSPMPALPLVPSYTDAVVTENAELKDALVAAVAEISELRRALLREIEPAVVALALRVGEKLAGAALEGNADAALAWVNEGIDALGEDKPIAIAISPAFAELLDTIKARAPGASIEVDGGLPRWGCVIRGSKSRVDVGLSSRVAAVAAALAAGDGG